MFIIKRGTRVVPESLFQSGVVRSSDQVFDKANGILKLEPSNKAGLITFTTASWGSYFWIHKVLAGRLRKLKMYLTVKNSNGDALAGINARIVWKAGVVAKDFPTSATDETAGVGVNTASDAQGRIAIDFTLTGARFYWVRLLSAAHVSDLTYEIDITEIDASGTNTASTIIDTRAVSNGIMKVLFNAAGSVGATKKIELQYNGVAKLLIKDNVPNADASQVAVDIEDAIVHRLRNEPIDGIMYLDDIGALF